MTRPDRWPAPKGGGPDVQDWLASCLSNMRQVRKMLRRATQPGPLAVGRMKHARLFINDAGSNLDAAIARARRDLEHMKTARSKKKKLQHAADPSQTALEHSRTDGERTDAEGPRRASRERCNRDPGVPGQATGQEAASAGAAP